jgi:hypothetical protein
MGLFVTLVVNQAVITSQVMIMHSRTRLTGPSSFAASRVGAVCHSARSSGVVCHRARVGWV